MKILDLDFKPFINRQKISLKVKQMANQINSNYKDRNPLFLVILNGAFIFAADLYREIDIPSQISFIKVSSYSKLNSTGSVKSLIGLSEKIRNRDLIIIEDIIDSGLTLKYLYASLHELGPASIEVAALFLKPGSYHGEIDIKYVGYSIPNHFIVGYGLDYDGYGRNLQDIYVQK